PDGFDVVVIVGPDIEAEWDELLHRMASAGGRRITGIETAPKAIAEGDIVVDRRTVLRPPLRVRAILGDHAWVHVAARPKDQGWGVHLGDLDHVEDTEVEEP